MGEKKNAHSILVGRPEGKRSLGGPRRRRKINLAQDRDRWRGGGDLVNAVLNLWVPYNIEKFLSI
jgi:hypothetical protein